MGSPDRKAYRAGVVEAKQTEARNSKKNKSDEMRKRYENVAMDSLEKAAHVESISDAVYFGSAGQIAMLSAILLELREIRKLLEIER